MLGMMCFSSLALLFVQFWRDSGANLDHVGQILEPLWGEFWNDGRRRTTKEERRRTTNERRTTNDKRGTTTNDERRTTNERRTRDDEERLFLFLCLPRSPSGRHSESSWGALRKRLSTPFQTIPALTAEASARSARARLQAREN